MLLISGGMHVLLLFLGCEDTRYHKLIFWNCLIQIAGVIKCEM
jgi:hypothetical protein